MREGKRWAHRVCGQMGEEEREEVGILGDWTRKGGQERIGEGREVCPGRHGETTRRRRRRRKIGAVAAGLRARQDYLPSGEKTVAFCLERKTQEPVLKRKGGQTDRWTRR